VRLVHRLPIAKNFPIFVGDPFEWLHFNEAYEMSSKLSNYSDRNNMAGLFAALRREAPGVVSTLLDVA
jgi:hypothetical protein